MSQCESLFIEAWKAGVELSVNGDKLHLEALSKPSDDLIRRLKEHKHELLRFLFHWIDTPYGEAKFWGFIGEDRFGMVLRNQPDRMKFIELNELMVKPQAEKKAAGQGDGRKWQKVAEWDFRREGNQMIGNRLDGPGETSWTIEDADPGAESEKLQTMIEDLTA